LGGVISADSHVSPPYTVWAEYLPGPLRGFAPRLEQTDEGDFLVIDGHRSAHDRLANLAGAAAKDYTHRGRVKDDERAGAWDPAARLADQDADGVAAEVLYGGASRMFQASGNAELRSAARLAYNRWLAGFCDAAPSRLIGLAELPVETPQEALAEVAAAVALGHRGFIIPAFPPSGSWGDEQWEPLWAAIEQTGFAVHYHLGARPYAPASDWTFLVHQTMSKLACAEPIAVFVFSGILQRHPGLKLVSVESGIGWLAFVAAYVDGIWERHRYWTSSPLDEPPSACLHRQVLATFLNDPVGIRERQVIGVGNIMWSSDYPHSETTWPDSRKIIDDQMQDCTAAEKQRIVHGNAAQLYKL
jgi:predicted TIM-barrel fold metal-dependent hydrolase